MGVGLASVVPSVAIWPTTLLLIIQVCSHFLYCNFVVGQYYLVDCSRYEQFVKVVVLA